MFFQITGQFYTLISHQTSQASETSQSSQTSQAGQTNQGKHDSV